jgi:hypothetical protein
MIEDETNLYNIYILEPYSYNYQPEYKELLIAGYITVTRDNNIKITEKGRKYIENLGIDALLETNKYWLENNLDIFFASAHKLCKIALQRLTKSELCIYMVHNNKYIRNLAKEIYDSKD